ncbi:hypothetical protein Sango_1156100 [Sesamum angolense]|uniref:Uncharacterized protein n=1 Tax=Sesamum angolense TaxID=2727404 RepID=A0AAE1WVU4_9LAMI|nr:hypothetical protein Sango_1156100 [Sesamum angolense]
MVSETNDNFSTIPPATVTGGGLIISITDTIRSFLTTASTDSRLPEDLRDLSSSLIMHSTVPYKSLKTIWFGSECETRPDVSSLLSGSTFVFTSPKPREKSEELKLRLKKLEEAAERKAYEELVKDITPKKGVEEPFSSYKDQLGFGLHVVLTMFTGYLLGYAAFRALFSHSPAMSAAGGILGLVGAMLVETLLFIVRSSNQDRRSPSPTSPSSTLRIKKDQ